MTNNFTHLHVHSEFSNLDGISTVEELVKTAKELGQTAIAITDHNRCSGHYDLEVACKKYGLKQIYGVEIYYTPSIEKMKNENYHLCLFAKNKKGLENIYEMMAKAHKTFYRKALVTYELLRSHSEGVICSSACIGGQIAQNLLQGSTGTVRGIIEDYKKLFGNDFYIEVQPNDIPEQLVVNKNLVNLAENYGINIIATNDVHYTYKSDAKIHEVALAMQVNKKWNDPKRFKFPTHDYWLKSREEMLEGFIKQGFSSQDINKWLNNTQLIVDSCEDFCMDDVLRIPHYHSIEENKTEKEMLAEWTWRGFEEKYGNHPDKEQIRKEVQEELDVIEECGYSGYHLIVADYIKFAKENGIIVSDGRG